MAKKAKNAGNQANKQLPAEAATSTEDRIVLRTLPGTLAPRLAGLLRERQEVLQRRSRAAKSTMGWCALAFVGLLAATYVLYLGGNWIDNDFGDVLYFAAFITALAALAPFFMFFGEFPALFGRDPQGGYLQAVVRYLEALRPDLHPEAPVIVEIDLRDIADAPTYRTATSPNSGASKTWHRAKRLRLVLVLADGSRFVYEAVEKRKLKSGGTVWSEGQLRCRFERPDAGAPPSSASPLWGWQSAIAGGPQPAWLFWRKASAFEETLIDLRKLMAAWQGARRAA